MWAGGVNKRLSFMHEFPAAQQVACGAMMLGMVAEGLFLILTCRELWTSSDSGSLAAKALPEVLVLAGLGVFYCIGCAINLPFWAMYQFLHFLALGLVAMAVACFNEAANCSSSLERSCLWRLFMGESLNLGGAAVLTLLDNDCTGVSCITEPFPWESSPCRFGVVEPPGSTCPLPEWFNHGAVMHALAIVSCAICVPALCTLLECGWEPRSRKMRTQ